MNLIRNIAFASLVLFTGGFGAAHAAGSATDAAEQYIDSLGGRFIDALKAAPDSDQRRDRLRAIFDESLDYPAIAKLALGRHWPSATDEQRADYLEVFRSYVVDLYTTQLDTYSGETYEVIRGRPIKEGLTMVSVEVARPEGPPFMLDFRLVAQDGGHRIVDVAVEGVSLVVTKRDEFSTVINREGIDGLIARLRQISDRTAAHEPPSPARHSIV